VCGPDPLAGAPVETCTEKTEERLCFMGEVGDSEVGTCRGSKCMTKTIF
jgi:hypothetical protein